MSWITELTRVRGYGYVNVFSGKFCDWLLI